MALRLLAAADEDEAAAADGGVAGRNAGEVELGLGMGLAAPVWRRVAVGAANPYPPGGMVADDAERVWRRGESS